MRIALSRTRKAGNDRGRVDVRADAAECVGDCGRDLDRVRVLILTPYYVVIHIRVLARVPVRG
jgi:hypothetical protein